MPPPRQQRREGGRAGGREGQDTYVPSIGSIIQVGASVKSGITPFADASSSPINKWVGKLLVKNETIAFSFSLSVSVTRSISPL